MSVRDEAHGIERCLRSVRSLVDRWVVVDTGSTDGTQAVVRAALAGLPGELVERPWVDVAHHRNESLDLARASVHAVPGDHALVLDADDVLTDVPDRLDLPLDGHAVTVRDGDLRYHRVALVALDRPWRWVGAVHGHLDLPGARTSWVPRPTIVRGRDGRRSHDPQRHRRDAAALEAELQRDPEDPHAQFHLAQAWRDAGETERALAAYRRRAANPEGRDQERWYALYQAAMLLDRAGRPAAEVTDALLEAFEARPRRAEPLVALARHERARGRHEVALLYAARAVEIAEPPAEELLVETDVYAWRAWDEYAVSAYEAGYLDSGERAARRALAARPDDERLAANLQAFVDRRTGRG